MGCGVTRRIWSIAWSLTHIEIDVEEIWIADPLHARLGPAEEEARAAPSHEACGDNELAVNFQDASCQYITISGSMRRLTKLGRRETAPEVIVPVVTVGVDGNRLKAEVILLKVTRDVLIQHVVRLGSAFLGGAVLVGCLHGGSCLGHCDESSKEECLR